MASLPCLSGLLSKAYILQDSKGGGEGFDVQKYGDGRVALIGGHLPVKVSSAFCTLRQQVLRKLQLEDAFKLLPRFGIEIKLACEHGGVKETSQVHGKWLISNVNHQRRQC